MAAEILLSEHVMSRHVRHVRQAKIQISLRIYRICSESSLGAFWIAKIDLSLRWAHVSGGTFFQRLFYSRVMFLFQFLIVCSFSFRLFVLFSFVCSLFLARCLFICSFSFRLFVLFRLLVLTFLVRFSFVHSRFVRSFSFCLLVLVLLVLFFFDC